MADPWLIFFVFADDKKEQVRPIFSYLDLKSLNERELVKGIWQKGYFLETFTHSRVWIPLEYFMYLSSDTLESSRWLQYCISHFACTECTLIFSLWHGSCKNRFKLYLHAVSSSFPLQHLWFLTARPHWFLLSENLVMILQNYQTDTPVLKQMKNWIMMKMLVKYRQNVCWSTTVQTCFKSKTLDKQSYLCCLHICAKCAEPK